MAYISATETFENGKQANFLLKNVHVKTVQIPCKCLNKHDMPTNLKRNSGVDKYYPLLLFFSSLSVLLTGDESVRFRKTQEV